LRQCTWRARQRAQVEGGIEDVGACHRDTGLGGGLVRRASWSWFEASRVGCSEGFVKRRVIG
jgi:hypothetical protein